MTCCISSSRAKAVRQTSKEVLTKGLAIIENIDDHAITEIWKGIEIFSPFFLTMKDNKISSAYVQNAEGFLDEAKKCVELGYDDLARECLEEAEDSLTKAKHWIENHWYFIQPTSFY